jgi:GNAT superfamily N-acetyltransferase
MASDGDIVVAGEPIVGVAIWFGPTTFGPSDAELEHHGIRAIIESAGTDQALAFSTMLGDIERLHDAFTRGPHLRLEFLGVDPESQGSGIGTSLMDYGHAKADAAAIPCYLETLAEENVPFYGRRGYRLIGQDTIAGGVRYFGLAREPR